MTTVDPPSNPAQDPWANAVDAYRDVAKWLIASFGAIGAVVAGTAPLTGIGTVSSSRLGWLAAGGATSLVGVTLVLASTIAVLIPDTVYGFELTAREWGWWRRTFVGLARFEDLAARHPEYLLPPGIASFGDLSAAITNLQQLYATESARVAALPQGDPSLDQAQSRAASMAAQLAAYQQSVADLRMVARFEKARTRFNQSVVAILGGGIVTAVGIAMLLYGIASKAGS